MNDISGLLAFISRGSAAKVIAGAYDVGDHPLAELVNVAFYRGIGDLEPVA
jgi:hypothetical protein